MATTGHKDLRVLRSAWPRRMGRGCHTFPTAINKVSPGHREKCSFACANRRKFSGTFFGQYPISAFQGHHTRRRSTIPPATKAISSIALAPVIPTISSFAVSLFFHRPELNYVRSGLDLDYVHEPFQASLIAFAPDYT